MKYFKRLGLYKASNVTYNPTTKEAYSYGWWQFSRKIGDKIFFNDTSYSPSTCKHQNKVWSKLYDTYERDIISFRLRDTINMRNLSDRELVERIILDYSKNIQDLLAYNQKPKVRQKTKDRNLETIKEIKQEIAEISKTFSDIRFDNELNTLLEGSAA